DAIARLVSDGVVVAIKYAVVRQDPSTDAPLEGLLARVDRARVVSGMGERPAVQHLRQFGLPGFTTGSGCVAPGLSQALFDACRAGGWWSGNACRTPFMPLEDIRDAWGPARVLHAAVTAAAIADPGPIPPFVSVLATEPAAAAARGGRTVNRNCGSRIADCGLIALVPVQQIPDPAEDRPFILSGARLRRRLVDAVGQSAERQRLQPHLARSAQRRKEQSLPAEERRLHLADELDVVAHRGLQRHQAAGVDAQGF